MEIQLKEATRPVWRADKPLVKRLTVSAETVVPDVCEDVQGVVWASCGLFLKGKDLSARGVSVAGEARIGLLCLQEDGRSLCALRLEKPFTLDFETPAPDPAALPQIAWRVTALEPRLLNPRKLAVSLELEARLRNFRPGELCLGQELPGGEQRGLHLLEETTENLALTAVTEKPFTLREQLSQPAGRPLPLQIPGQELDYRILGAEQVGERCVVKGELRLRLTGLTEGGEPAESRFSLPFSQLLESGEESWDFARITALPSSCYLDWTEAIGGEKALDAEIHGVLQARFWRRESCRCVRDAYSSRMPCACLLRERTEAAALLLETASLQGEGTIPLQEAWGELLAAQPFVGAPESDRESLGAALSLDLLFRSAAGELIPVRRSLRLEGEALPPGAEPEELLLTRLELKPEGASLSWSAGAELRWTLLREESSPVAASLCLDEEQPYDRTGAPSLTLVRRGGESLWELAKTYRSSPEAIAACCDADGELVLIPRE